MPTTCYSQGYTSPSETRNLPCRKKNTPHDGPLSMEHDLFGVGSWSQSHVLAVRTAPESSQECPHLASNSSVPTSTCKSSNKKEKGFGSENVSSHNLATISPPPESSETSSDRKEARGTEVLQCVPPRLKADHTVPSEPARSLQTDSAPKSDGKVALNKTFRSFQEGAVGKDTSSPSFHRRSGSGGYSKISLYSPGKLLDKSTGGFTGVYVVWPPPSYRFKHVKDECKYVFAVLSSGYSRQDRKVRCPAQSQITSLAERDTKDTLTDTVNPACVIEGASEPVDPENCDGGGSGNHRSCGGSNGADAGSQKPGQHQPSQGPTGNKRKERGGSSSGGDRLSNTKPAPKRTKPSEACIYWEIWHEFHLAIGEDSALKVPGCSADTEMSSFSTLVQHLTRDKPHKEDNFCQTGDFIANFHIDTDSLPIYCPGRALCRRCFRKIAEGQPFRVHTSCRKINKSKEERRAILRDTFWDGAVLARCPGEDDNGTNRSSTVASETESDRQNGDNLAGHRNARVRNGSVPQESSALPPSGQEPSQLPLSTVAGPSRAAAHPAVLRSEPVGVEGDNHGSKPEVKLSEVAKIRIELAENREETNAVRSELVKTISKLVGSDEKLVATEKKLAHSEKLREALELKLNRTEAELVDARSKLKERDERLERVQKAMNPPAEENMNIPAAQQHVVPNQQHTPEFQQIETMDPIFETTTNYRMAASGGGEVYGTVPALSIEDWDPNQLSPDDVLDNSDFSAQGYGDFYATQPLNEDDELGASADYQQDSSGVHYTHHFTGRGSEAEGSKVLQAATSDSAYMSEACQSRVSES